MCHLLLPLALSGCGAVEPDTCCLGLFCVALLFPPTAWEEAEEAFAVSAVDLSPTQELYTRYLGHCLCVFL